LIRCNRRRSKRCFCARRKDRYKTESKQARFQEQTKDGPRAHIATVKNGSDLFELSNERANYKDGFVVAEINAEPGNEFIRFDNGRSLRLGEEMGGMQEDIWRTQIKHTSSVILIRSYKSADSYQGFEPLLC